MTLERARRPLDYLNAAPEQLNEVQHGDFDGDHRRDVAVIRSGQGDFQRRQAAVALQRARCDDRAIKAE